MSLPRLSRCYVLVVIFLTGCASPAQQLDRSAPVFFSPQQAIVSFATLQENPPTATSPQLHRWYGVRIGTQGHLLTVKHLLPDQLDYLVITDRTGNVYHLKQLRLHPTLDLALLQLEPTKHTWSFFSLGETQSETTQKWFFFSGTQRLAADREKTNDWQGLLRDQKATPGMSGSPVWDAHNSLLGLITKQTAEGVQFLLTKPLIQQWVTEVIISST